MPKSELNQNANKYTELESKHLPEGVLKVLSVSIGEDGDNVVVLKEDGEKEVIPTNKFEKMMAGDAEDAEEEDGAQ